MVDKEQKIENVDIKRGMPKNPILCRDCVFLKISGAYKDNKGSYKPCEYFGTLPQSEPCRLFVPNPRTMRGPIGQALEILSKIQNPYAAIASFNSSKRLRSTGFKVGQKVFFHVLGKDYVCNYASGYIIGYVNNLLVIEGNEGHVSQIQPESALNEDAWNVKLGYLLKNNKINDPDGGLRKIHDGNKFNLTSYVPASLTNKKKKYIKVKTEKVRVKIKKKSLKTIKLR